MPVRRDARLGRMAFVTVEGDVTEALGDQLEAVGGAVVAGTRRPRPFKLALPVRGDTQEADPYAAGERLRRQVRSLLENATAKGEGLYFRFLVDAEQNGWLLVGGGDLQYAEGGITMADFTLQLEDAYRVATRRTHRDARRVEQRDRRLSTTPRDILGTVFSTDFANHTPYAVTPLPVGAADVLGVGRRVVTAGSRPSVAGNLPVVQGATHAEVLQYERDEVYVHGADDVVLYDTRGAGDPSPGYGAAVHLLRPAVWYRMQEQAGATQLADASENRHHATPVGSVQFAQASPIADPGDYSVGFNEEAGIYARAADLAALDADGALTVVGWIAPQVGTPNLMVNGGFENELHPWGTYVTATGVTGVVLERSNAWAAEGSYSARLAASFTSGFSNKEVYMWPFVSGSGNDGNPRVIAGRTYTMAVRVHIADAATDPALSLRLGWDWLDGDGWFVASELVDLGRPAPGEYTYTLTATAPVGVQQIFPYLWWRATGTVGTTDTINMYVDAWRLVEGAVAVPWADTRPRYDTVASKWRSVSSGRSWRFGYDAYLGELVLQVSLDGSSYEPDQRRVQSVGLPVLVPGEDVHVGVVYNRTTDTVTFYRNGVAFSTQGPGVTLANIYNSTTKLTLGKWEADA